MTSGLAIKSSLGATRSPLAVKDAGRSFDIRRGVVLDRQHFFGAGVAVRAEDADPVNGRVEPVRRWASRLRRGGPDLELQLGEAPDRMPALLADRVLQAEGP